MSIVTSLPILSPFVFSFVGTALVKLMLQFSVPSEMNPGRWLKGATKYRSIGARFLFVCRSTREMTPRQLS